MTDYRAYLEHDLGQIGPANFTLGDVIGRRDRKRRNQRITAGVVGIAVFVAAVWLVTSGGVFDRTQTPAVPGPTETAPVPGVWEDWAYDPSLSRVNVIDLPPEGASPSAPERGELVLRVSGRGIGTARALTHMNLYADGRLIWWREGVFSAGANTLHEQRLTPEGVELMRSEVISSQLFDQERNMVGPADPDPLSFEGWIEVRDGDRMVGVGFAGPYVPGNAASGGDRIATAEQERALGVLDERLADPASWLPASAWANQQIRVYVPSAYSACYGGGPTISDGDERVAQEVFLDGLPGSARGLLQVKQTRELLTGGPGPGIGVAVYCSNLTAEEARVVIGALDEARLDRRLLPSEPTGMTEPHVRSTFEYRFSVQDPIETAEIWIDPRLPDGAVVCIPCG